MPPVSNNRNNEPNALKPTKNYYLFVVGVDYYANDQHPRLNNPIRDANNLISTLTEKYTFEKPPHSGDLRLKDADNYGEEREAIFTYQDIKFTSLYNTDATKKNILTHLKTVFSQIQAEDAFLFYFSGHGASENELGYILPHDAENDNVIKNGWIQYNELYQFINTAKNKCRDVLFILDCCYSGAITLETPNNIVTNHLSRYVLTSCNHEELAQDGLKGSPFANALQNALKGKNPPVFTIQNILENIKKDFDRSLKFINPAGSQEILYKPLPVKELGQGEFVFCLKEQDKPELPHLTETFEKHLDFDEQRGKLQDEFNPLNAQFNVIATCGNSANGQKLLTKILFRVLEEDLQFFNPNTAQRPFKIDIGSNFKKEKEDSPEDLLRYMANGLMGNMGEDKNAALKFPPTVEGMATWIYEKMSETSTPSVFRLLIRVNFGDKKLFADIDTFCCSLKEQLAALIAKLPAEDQTQFGKLFIILSDERQAEQGFSDDFSAKIRDSANVIIMQKVKNINTNHVKKWVLQAKNNIQTNKFKNIDEKNLRPKGKEDVAFYDYSIDDFTERVCNYCNFDATEINNLYTLLYDFQS